MRRQRVLGEPPQDVAPPHEHRAGGLVHPDPAGVRRARLQIDELELEGRVGPAVLEANPLAEREVVGDDVERVGAILQPDVAIEGPVLDHVEDQRGRADLEVGRDLGHVGVAHDDVQPTEALAVGVRLVTRVDHRPAGHRGAGHLARDVLGALADAVAGAARFPADPARPGEDLPGGQKGNQPLHEPGKGRGARHEVVLVAAVGVPGRVRVVLERVHPPREAVLRQAGLGPPRERPDESLAGPVVRHQLEEVVALRRGVLRVKPGVHVESSSILQEGVRISRARDDLLEEVSGEHFGRQDRAAVLGARGAVLTLQAEDPALHLTLHEGKRRA